MLGFLLICSFFVVIFAYLFGYACGKNDEAEKHKKEDS